MKILSLFDGISCGQLALKKLNIKYDSYFSSEIDKNAIKVTQYNFPNTIQLGDVKEIKRKNLPDIDLLIGGSPCQGFSIAGKRLNFKDKRSKLFFEFVRLLNEFKPQYFLLENVKMKKEYQNIISDFLNVEPTEINSSLLSSQNRKRLYWTNIQIKELKQKYEINFDGYLYRLGHGYVKDEIKFFKKYPALSAQSPATKYRIVVNLEEAKLALLNGDFKKIRYGDYPTRSASPEECENFQTIPIGYTKILNKTQRYKCIGNAWTVNVISHIFGGISI